MLSHDHLSPEWASPASRLLRTVFLYDYFLNDLFCGEQVPRLKASAPKRFGHDLHIIDVLIDRRKILTHRNDGNVTPADVAPPRSRLDNRLRGLRPRHVAMQPEAAPPTSRGAASALLHRGRAAPDMQAL
jgi:hypothetical protein